MGSDNGQNACQATQLDCASVRVPKVVAWVYRCDGYLRQHGLLATLSKIFSRLREERSASIPIPAQPVLCAQKEALCLQPGEWVVVRPYEEICRTLDAEGKHRGLLFMPQMAEYSGRRMKVYRAVERIFVEETKDVRRMRNTVLLEGSLCDGLSVGCDRSCFHFWREAWLRRADEVPAELEWQHQEGESAYSDASPRDSL